MLFQLQENHLIRLYCERIESVEACTVFFTEKDCKAISFHYNCYYISHL